MNELRSQKRRFIFKGNAVGAAGSFFPVKAATALPVIGGKAHAGVGMFPNPEGGCDPDVGRFISFDSCASEASGQFRDISGTYETTVTSTTTGLKLFPHWDAAQGTSLLEVSLLSARLESAKPKGEETPSETQILLPHRPVQVVGLKVLGRAVKVQFRPDLMEFSTRKELQSRIDDDCSFRQKYGDRLLENHGYYYYSVVDLSWQDEPAPEVQLDGHAILIRNGKVASFYLGEVLRGLGSCRLTLLRGSINTRALQASATPRRDFKASPQPFLSQGIAEPTKLEEVAFCEVESNGLESEVP